MDEVFKRRHSVRSFQDKALAEEKLEEILEAAHSAPSAGNLKAREIVVVKNKETKIKLAAAAFNQDFIAEGSIVLVFFAVPSRSAQKYGRRGSELYAVQDATIAASFAWLQAVMLSIDACWVGAFDEEKVKEILDARNDWRPIAILPLGYSYK
jgi:nitroreductase